MAQRVDIIATGLVLLALVLAGARAAQNLAADRATITAAAAGQAHPTRVPPAPEPRSGRVNARTGNTNPDNLFIRGDDAPDAGQR